MNTKYQYQQQKNVLITGASGGIGYEFAKFFADDGYHLVLVDKRGEKLVEIADEFQQQYNISVEIIAQDLSIPRAAEEIFSKLQQASIKIDVLVNNAGFGSYGFFHETDLSTELQMLQLNVVCLTHLTKLFLKDMVNQGSGKILNVASTAAFQPGPLMAVYFATKAYVLSFSEAIANELEGTGVTVTVLCPGATASGFHETSGMSKAKVADDWRLMDSETVAKIGYQGLMANKTVVIPGVKNKILATSAKFANRKLVTKIVRNMHETQK
ncbi:MAG: SDR family oxidoreductase [Stigonema ocellatum SAG 48.90 = DSM 106950]|nr:SDR family oxidoreductase [Stigonema ocellatum SAG 48.90 = DSM 106950]